MTACLAALGLAPIPASARLAPMEVRAQAQQTGAISGNVVDQADSPVADVVVTTTDASGNIYTAATDADGAFTLPDLPAPASYVLTFTPPAGYGGATFTTGVSPGETFSIGYITVQAQPGAVVGVVTDQDGVPLDGMQVQVSSFVTTTTDSDGGYALAGLLPGSYPLTVIDGNDALAEGTVSIAGDTVTVNVTLPRPAVPAGTTARDAARDRRSRSPGICAGWADRQRRWDCPPESSRTRDGRPSVQLTTTTCPRTTCFSIPRISPSGERQWVGRGRANPRFSPKARDGGRTTIPGRTHPST